jgi:hypothetical protein
VCVLCVKGEIESEIDLVTIMMMTDFKVDRDGDICVCVCVCVCAIFVQRVFEKRDRVGDRIGDDKDDERLCREWRT